MKFGKQYSNMSVFMAILHGVLIGIGAVAVIGLLLMNTNGKDSAGANGDKVATSGPEGKDEQPVADSEAISLVAKQHGVFSSKEAATSFMNENPALAKAALVEVDGQFYVWSMVGAAGSTIPVSAEEGTFRKPFTANPAACEAVGASKLREVMTATELAQIKSLAKAEEGVEPDEKTKAFNSHIAAMTTFTDDVGIVKLHLLSHYSHTDPCVKISF
ncbi:hypothetical protein [Sporosarcina sp. HYO08]|uniref:hypothetical protein n=1 Tax=Sporosarcina sp. HYO08 TaxID=1759557 RepID=UPI00079B4005|nr:hypothetical protein [Sporosarcina sp. HYO08]KXH87318.1 hypothetical protein AU377_01720 [Sporosarcina sp. HYO08]